MKSYLHDSGRKMFTGEVMYSSFMQIAFSHVRGLPSSLSDTLVEVIVTDNQMKCTVTLNKITDFSGGEYTTKQKKPPQSHTKMVLYLKTMKIRLNWWSLKR